MNSVRRAPLHRTAGARLSVLVLVVHAVLATVLWPGNARGAPKDASPDDLKTAKALFQRALAYQDAGKWQEALELLRKVAATRETAQVRFNVAFSEEHLGRTIEAARGYERAILLAERQNAPHVAHHAKRRLDKLESRIARVFFRPRTVGAAVKVDGVRIAAADVDRPFVLAPGAHVVDAEADGKVPTRRALVLKAGETQELPLLLDDAPKPAPALVATAEPSPKPPGELTPSAARPKHEAEKKPEKSGVGPLPYVVAGAGVASLAASGVFHVLRARELDTLREQCPGLVHCSPELRPHYDRGVLYTTLANVTLFTGAGLVGVGGGLYVWKSSSGKTEKPPEKKTGFEVTISGTF